MNLEINGRKTPVASSLKTIGDLLALVDHTVAVDGEIVTAVRLDGVDEAAFRAPAFHARPLAEIGAISIESDTPQGLARRCLGEAALELDAIEVSARAAANYFRGDEIGGGRGMLADLTHNIMGMVHVVATARTALVSEFEVAGQGGSSIKTLTADLDRLVGELTTSQQDEDWVNVADVLQYDLAPLMLRWKATLLEIAAA